MVCCTDKRTALAIFYTRMAIKSRLERLEVTSPPERLESQGSSLHERAKQFKENLLMLSCQN
jgi:hypothetical protein